MLAAGHVQRCSTSAVECHLDPFILQQHSAGPQERQESVPLQVHASRTVTLCDGLHEEWSLWGHFGVAYQALSLAMASVKTGEGQSVSTTMTEEHPQVWGLTHIGSNKISIKSASERRSGSKQRVLQSETRLQ